MRTETVADLIAETGLTHAELAALAGLSRDLLTNWVAGHGRAAPKNRSIGRLQAALASLATERGARAPSVADVRRAILESRLRARFATA